MRHETRRYTSFVPVLLELVMVPRRSHTDTVVVP